MLDMVVAPEIVGRQRDDADEPADPVIGARRTEKRPVAAIMLDHEQPDDEPRSRHNQ